MAETIKLKDNKKLTSQADFFKKVRDFTTPTKESIIHAKYIVPYQTEKKGEKNLRQSFANRLERSAPLTFTEGYLRQHHACLAQNLVFQNFGSSENKDSVEDTILEDVTGFEKSAQQMFSDLVWEYLAVGLVAVEVSKDSNISITLGGAKQNNERSFQTLIEAERIKEIKFFKNGQRKGQLQEFIYVTEQAVEQEQFASKIKEKRRRYFMPDDSKFYVVQELEQIRGTGNLTTKDPQEYTILEEKYSSTEGPIPIVIFGEGAETSEARRIIDLDCAFVNRLSVYSNINYNQGFQRVILAGIKDPKEAETIGESIATAISSDIQVHTIEPGDPSSTKEELQMLAYHIRRIALYESNQLADDTRQIQSADSKAKDLKARKKVYDDIINYFQQKVTKIYRFHASFDAPASADQVQVIISRDFELDDSELDLAEDSLIFSWAGQLGLIEVQKSILARRVSKMEFVSTETESAEQVKARVIKEIQQSNGQPAATNARLNPGLYNLLRDGQQN